MNDAVNNYLHFLCKRKGVPIDSVRGLSVDIIHEWEAKNGKRLPEVYKDYLIAMGPSFDWLISDNIEGSVRSADSFDELRTIVNEFLEVGSSSFRLQKDDIVLSIYQRESFRFFRLGEGDDPPVYGFDDGDETYSLHFKRLTKYLGCR